jgi:hypothetical protein
MRRASTPNGGRRTDIFGPGSVGLEVAVAGGQQSAADRAANGIGI